jgi:23S rRNA (cytidine1920-2'-O)/16S rRNA (cytidine1409-2'-O)-methyltransferase
LALVERGLARSRNQAASLIEAERVLVNKKVSTKASLNVEDDAKITVKADLDLVSRAGFKLENALRSFSEIDVQAKTCLDVGASTGGFTQVLLNHGAKTVVALDVGHDQMAPEISGDPRVYNIEGFNARELSIAALEAATGRNGLHFDLVVADLSFISLELVLPAMVATAPNAEMLVLVKPQFEVGRLEVGSGVVLDAVKHQAALEKVSNCAWELGLGVKGIVNSGLAGVHGNIEYVLWISRDSKSHPSEWTQRFSNLIGEVL